jgi:type II secretory pathway component PulF
MPFLRVSLKERIFLLEHFYFLLKGGIPVSEALNILAEETKKPSLKRVLSEIGDRLKEGEKLSSAMGRYPQIFTPLLINLIKVGERTGTLEENLKRGVYQLERDFKLREELKRAMIYPLILIFLGIFILFGVTFFVIPKLKAYFESLNIPLPVFLQIFASLVSFLKENFRFVLAFFLFLVLLFKILLYEKTTKILILRFVLDLPFFGNLLKNLNLAQLSRNFYLLVKSGLSLIDSFDIAIDVLGNEIYKKDLIFIKNRVLEGERLAPIFRLFPREFPIFFVSLISAGEKAGFLEDSFLILSEFYQRESERQLKTLPTLIEPILLILIGLFILFLALSIIIPIYRFIGQVTIRLR